MAEIPEPFQQCSNSICIPCWENYPKLPFIYPKQGFDFNEALEGVYPLISIICGYLPYKDLLVVGELSENWKKNAEREMKKRKFPGWVEFVKRKNAYKLHHSAGFDSSQKGMGFVLYHYKKIKLDTFVCLHKCNGLQRETFYSHITDDVAKPAKDFVCISLETMYNSVPDHDSKSFFSWFHLPDIPNVRMQQFYFTNGSKEVFNEIIRDNERLDTLLVFTLKNPEPRLKQLIKQLCLKQDCDVSLGGGIVWGIKSSTCTPSLIKRTDLFCLAFLRDTTHEREFYSASTITKESGFEEDLLEFKEQLEFHEHSVIFRFCCIGKSDSEIEDGLLRKHFPATMFVQMDVNGEIGCHYTKNSGDDPGESKKVKKEMTLVHAFTSTLVYITWGKQKVKK